MMFKQCNASEHYKMYKKGKSWVFAGILTTFYLVTVGGTEVAHADTIDDDSAANTSQQTATDVKTTKQVTLKAGPTSSEPEVKDTEVPEADEQRPDQPGQDVQEPESQTPVTPDTPAPEVQDPVNQDPQPDEQSGSESTESPVVQNDKKQADIGSDVKNDGMKDETQSVRPVASRRSQNLRLAAVPSAPQPVVAAPEDASAAVTADQSIDEWMPNKRLQTMVLWTLNNSNLGRTWTSASDITKDDMLLLTTLSTTNGRFSAGTWISTHIDGQQSFSLEGLQYATNLTSLDLINNLNIGEGWYYGDITDISPLKALTKLVYLQLSSNRVTDISPIAGLKNLTKLQIPYNCISDFSSLNAAQYTQGFAFNNQLIIEEPVSVDGKTRMYTLPSAIKLPQNYGAVPTVGEGRGWEHYTRDEFYEFLPAGTATEDGQGNVTFTEIPDQVMPGRTHDDDGLVNHQLPYQRYMSRVYTFNGGNVIVFEVYTPYTISAKAAAVTVHYQDGTGRQIADDLTLPSAMVGDNYTTTPLTITGYKLKTTPANATGTYGDQAIDVIYVYDEMISNVIIHYQDTTGKSLLADKLVTGQVGTDYAVTYPEISGYTYSRTNGQVTGVYGDSPTEVTFIYTKDTVTPPVTPSQNVTVTVHYQTADGTQVAPDVVITGKTGDTYETSPATNIPDGYELVTTPANATGTMGDSDIAVIYLYAKTDGDGAQVDPGTDKPTKPTTEPDEVTPTKPAKQPAKGGQADRVMTGQRTPAKGGAAATGALAAKPNASVPSATNAKTTLPQTDEKTVSPLWGLALLGGLLGLAGLRKKLH